jgi:hypothetical protein
MLAGTWPGSLKHTYLLDQITSLGADETRHGHITPGNLLLCHDGSVLKRRFTTEELVGQDAQAPQVNCLAVEVVSTARLDHLWWQVVQSTAHCVTAVVRRMYTPAKVRDLELAVDADEDVLGLDVAVHDVFLVKVFECSSHLRNVLRSFPLWEAVLLSEVLVQLPLACILEDQENALRVVKVSIEAENVWVSQMTLDLDLSSHLFLHLSLLDLVLVEDFQSANESGGALPCEIDTTELSLTKRLSDLEHA